MCRRTGNSKTLIGIGLNDRRCLLDYRPRARAADADDCYIRLLGCYDDRDCPAGEGYVYATVNVVFRQP